jgi:hypothetical protein
MTDHLYPTPSRLRYLAEAEAGTLPLLLTVAMAELKTAGWIELGNIPIDGPEPQRWRPTAYGRAIAAIRVLEREDGRHIVAETGDEDEPRVLGDAMPVHHAELPPGLTCSGGSWLVSIRIGDGGSYAVADTKHQAHEELRHMAASLLAAESTTVQEGQNTVSAILAWHGRADLKEAAVRRMHQHREDDSFIQGLFVEANVDAAAGYRGCFHGCLTTEALMSEQNIRSAAFLRIRTTWYDEGQRLFGIPTALGVLLDKTFEALDPAECAAFAVDTVEAIPVGADLTGVLDRLAYEVLTDEWHGMREVTAADTDERQAVDRVAELFRRRIAGDEPLRTEWVAAGDAAAAAYRGGDGRAADAADVADDLADNADPEVLIDAAYTVRHPAEYNTWLAARIVHHLAAAPVPATVGEA